MKQNIQKYLYFPKGKQNEHIKVKHTSLEVEAVWNSNTFAGVRGWLGVLTLPLLWAQGWESLRDSLLLENERIETLELDQRPLPFIQSIERPTWAVESLQWEEAPLLPRIFPSTLQPSRPVWTKRAPFHLSYGLGRFWTHTVGIHWGRTRDLFADEGVSFTHASTAQGHVPRARWGQTHLTAWIGRYAEGKGWEATYRGGYESFVFYAPYAEGWAGFSEDTPLLDTLKGHYFRQELRTRAYHSRFGEIQLESRRLDFRRGRPEWQGMARGQLRPFMIGLWQNQSGGQLFLEGRRVLLSLYTWLDRDFPAWSIRGGARIALGSDSAFRFLPAPLLRIMYKGVSPLWRPYLEVQGDLRPITYFSASELNPYLKRGSATLPFMREPLNLQLGFRGQGRGWDYQIAGEYLVLRQVPLFTPDSSAFFQLQTLASFESQGAVFQFSYAPVLPGPCVEMRGVYRRWQANPSPYSLPSGELWLRFTSPFRDRFWLSVSTYFISSRLLAPQVEAPPFVDISWEGHAQVLPFLSLFAGMNNLLNQRFYRWYGYRERPVDFRFGIWIKLG